MAAISLSKFERNKVYGGRNVRENSSYFVMSIAAVYLESHASLSTTDCFGYEYSSLQSSHDHAGRMTWEGLRESCTALAASAVAIGEHSGNGIGAHSDRVNGENGGCAAGAPAAEVSARSATRATVRVVPRSATRAAVCATPRLTTRAAIRVAPQLTTLAAIQVESRLTTRASVRMSLRSAI